MLRNFIWSGNPANRKAITVNWDSCCKPYNEGGLNMRKLKEVNNALILKMAWSFLNGESQFAKYMRSKYCNRDGDLIEYHKRSSLWPGLKWGIVYMKKQTTWAVGDGSTIDLWRDS
ncbi:hypothetical protein FRX31_014264 [Thalictrum thalictroides]|uniref:Uncharacterized protein n=1 Tax=Thalictrum thalictroides TaxID=46969 RepID=A0A7J6WFF4_THATH|nr:hypothetical protein FRX31_014264 [Thalictrum thalictroides]